MFPRPEFELVEDQKRILRHLRRHGVCSRTELSHTLKINNGVVTRLTRELIALGLISEGEQTKPGGRGRPSLPLALRSDGAYAVGIAINIGWVDITVVNFAGESIARTSFEYDAVDPGRFADDLNAQVSAVLRSSSVLRARFLGFGIAVPGFAQQSPARRFTVDRLRLWRNVDLAKLFRKNLGGPVWIENDANAAALAEYYCDAMYSVDSMLLFYLGFGVGGGCIAGGRLFRGTHLNAGEIGAMFPLDEPRPSALDLASALNDGGDHSFSLLDLRDRDDSAEHRVRDWSRRAADQLYVAALAGACWFDPGAIVVGGTLPNWTTELLAQHLREKDWKGAIGDRPIPVIRHSVLKGSAAAIGAAILPMHETVSPEI